MMLPQELYPAVFARKSIRRYDAAQPLTPEQLAAVKAEMAKAVPLLPGEQYRLELGAAKEGWRVYGYCENTPLSNANLGFVMQQLDLALYSQGLGRLWYGFGRDPKDKSAPKGLSYAICLKVGVAAEPLARESADEFTRKPIEKVTDDPALQALFEPVRLAPSAMNSQPWFFTARCGGIHAWRKHALIKVQIGRMNQVDMGIALCHAALALGHAGKGFAVEVDAPADEVKGYDYLLTLRMK